MNEVYPKRIWAGDGVIPVWFKEWKDDGCVEYTRQDIITRMSAAVYARGLQLTPGTDFWKGFWAAARIMDEELS